jgi:serpin B
MRYVAATLLALTPFSTGRADEARGGGPMSDVVRGNNRFALDLYARLRQQPGNVFYSPYSISTALAMTYAGARGQTAEQMARTLHFELPPDRLHSAYQDLIRHINGDGTRPYQLLVANALWGREGTDFRPEFLKVVKEHYYAEVSRLDFRSAEPARRTINAWVEERTRDKIKDLIGPGALHPDTLLVLTDAIYFKGEWASPFLKRGTRQEDFRVSAAEKLKVPMMHRVGRYGYVEGEGLQALELPYKGDALAMVVLLPGAESGLPKLEESLSEAKLADWTARLSPREVRVALPRFRLERGIELKEVLSGMGMPDAFTGGADFSGMTGRREPYLSAVIHKAFVDVNEEGTEATAATGVVMRPLAAPVDRAVEFRADRPFLFLIRERRTGSILFLGRVTDPRG